MRTRRLRRSTVLFTIAAIVAALGLAAVVDARARRRAGLEAARSRAALVARLGLTDLCLFTEARYTRHPSQADRFTAIGDHPLALEHFPSGSLVPPPPPPSP